MDIRRGECLGWNSFWNILLRSRDHALVEISRLVPLRACALAAAFRCLGRSFFGRWFMPDEMGVLGWGIALAAFCFMLALSWRLWSKILSWLQVLKSPPDRLHRIVFETAQRL